MDARIIELEIRYTHQQRLLEELSDVVAEQARALEGLTKELAALRQRVAALGEDEPNNDPPPHY
jgi:SlyX protein